MKLEDEFLPELGEKDKQAIQHIHYSVVKIDHPAFFRPQHVRPNLPVLILDHGAHSIRAVNQALTETAAKVYNWKRCKECHNGYMATYTCFECDGKGCETCNPHNRFKGLKRCTVCGDLEFA